MTFILSWIRTVLTLCLIGSNIALATVLWLSVFTRNQHDDNG